MNNSQKAFWGLVKAGLWKSNTLLSPFGKIDYSEILRLAEEQSVVGLVAAGFDHVTDVKVPQKDVLQFVGQALQIEQRNIAMNVFVAKLIEKLHKENIFAVLVKGQGIAQCYEKPLWRACGDVDLLLSSDNYEKAKQVLIPLATDVEQEYSHFKHQGMTMPGGFVVELHGTLHSRLSRRVDCVIDDIQRDVFFNGSVRSWNNSDTIVFLPSADNDVIFVFTHILHHFFFEGIGLRQICDWCRLLWTYRDKLNLQLLEKRLRQMGLMTEWKAFGAFAVEYLGMPMEAMPFYSDDNRWKKKASQISAFVLEVGNFGYKQRRDYSGMSYIGRKFVSFWGRLSDMLRHISIFPKDSILFFGGVLRSGLHAAVRGE